MSYFFDLEDHIGNCNNKGDLINESITNELRLIGGPKETYLAKNGTYNGYEPKQETIIINSDGIIDIFIGTFGKKTPIELGDFCCTVKLPNIINDFKTKEGLFTNIDTNNIYWDANVQKCKWKEEINYCEIDSFKVLINAVGNDGALFNIDDNDKECSLKVEFDYLFKLDCQNLANILNPAINTNTNLDLLKQINFLQNAIEEIKIDCSQISFEISNTTNDFLNSQYSITSCPNSVPFAYGIKPKNNNNNKPINITYCIIEENNGLIQWQNILGPSRYKRFLDGDPESYNCDDITTLIEINNQLITSNNPTVIEECTTPFGYKSNLKIQIDKLIKEQKKCDAKINELENKLNELLIEIDTPSSCATPIEVLETLDVSMTLEVVNNDGSLTSVFETDLFPEIGIGNLYEYLKNHPYDSGFYLCGKPNYEESWSNGCTVLKFNDELIGPSAPFTFECNDASKPADFHCNVESCRIVKDSFLKGLYVESGLSNSASDRDTFKYSLSKEIFASKWLNFTTLIDDINVLETIKNKKVKISLNINNTCSDICVYVDNIKLIRNCLEGNGKSVFINESPGFNLDRIIDNKKSWLNNSIINNRDFDIANNQGTNIIRKTDYDVNDERLVINTKEIDLDINIASAIENDVQCFINDNENLLNGGSCDISYPINTSTFLDVDVELLDEYKPYSDIEDYYTCFRSLRNGWINYFNSGLMTEWLNENLEIENITCGRLFKFNCGGFIFLEQENKCTELYAESETFGIIKNNDDEMIEFINIFISSFNIIINASKLNKSYLIKNNCPELCPSKCGDLTLDFNELISKSLIDSTTNEQFDNHLTTELIDVKNRKTLSNYATLRALYNRYVNSFNYIGIQSSAYDYNKMDGISNMVGTYWVDVIEQVIPATTIWGSTKIYSNTMFDQQKFTYKKGTLFTCLEDLKGLEYLCGLSDIEYLNDCMTNVIDKFYTDDCIE